MINRKFLLSIALVILFLANTSYAELLVDSADYIPYSTDPSVPFTSHWLVDAYVTPDWNEVLITSNDPNFIDTDDGVTVKDTGKINAIINNVKCNIKLSNTIKNIPELEDNTLRYYGVDTFNVGILYSALKNAKSTCKEKTGADPIWVGYYLDFPYYYLVCVHPILGDNAAYYRPYVLNDAEYEFDINLEYSKEGKSGTNRLELHVPDKEVVSDSYIELLYEFKILLEGYQDYCSSSYLNDHFLFVKNRYGYVMFTTANKFREYMSEYNPDKLVEKINFETDAVFDYALGIYKISGDDVDKIKDIAISANKHLADLWLSTYDIDSNTRIDSDEIIFFSSPIKAKVRLRLNSIWLGIQRLNPEPEIISVQPSYFEIRSYQTKTLSLTVKNNGNDGNVILKVKDCDVIDIVAPTTKYLKGGETETFDVTIQAKSVIDVVKQTCSIVVCDPSEKYCSSKSIDVKVLPVCEDECSPGLPYCEGNSVVTCKWDEEKQCYRKQYMQCEVACVDGKCVDQPPTVCGNGICEVGETVDNCPIDCRGPVCGNRVCEIGETPDNCPIDCKPPGPDWKTKLIIALVISILILILIIKLLLRRR